MPKRDEGQTGADSGWGKNPSFISPAEVGRLSEAPDKYQERVISGPKPDSSYEPRMVHPEYGPHRGGPAGLPNKSKGTKLR